MRAAFLLFLLGCSTPVAPLDASPDTAEDAALQSAVPGTYFGSMTGRSMPCTTLNIAPSSRDEALAVMLVGGGDVQVIDNAISGSTTNCALRFTGPPDLMVLSGFPSCVLGGVNFVFVSGDLAFFTDATARPMIAMHLDYRTESGAMCTELHTTTVATLQ